MNPFKGRHFQRDIILWAVRWYCKYGISYRELGNDSNLLIVFYVQIMPDDFVMQLHRF